MKNSSGIDFENNSRNNSFFFFFFETHEDCSLKITLIRFYLLF